MPPRAPLYDDLYGHLDSDPQTAVRRATYDEDLGQASWLMLAEAKAFFHELQLHPGQRALEVACGSGGITCRLATETGATCVGVDLNPHGIAAARRRARDQHLDGRVTFEVADAGQPLPFADATFDAVFCNDSINHFPGRPAVLRDWHRVLRPGGRLLYTDPLVVTGQLTNDELRARSAIGYFVFTPTDCNERLLREAGFQAAATADVTEGVITVSRRWHEERAARRAALVAQEGADAFESVQRFLGAVHTLAAERRLSRFKYLAEKPAPLGA